jgi:hypothetical protein
MEERKYIEIRARNAANMGINFRYVSKPMLAIKEPIVTAIAKL